MQKDIPKPINGPSAMKRNMLNIGIAGVAGALGLAVMYPVESLKTIIQLKCEAGTNPSCISTLRDTIKTGGFGTLYKGFPAAMLRQFFFASIRVGLYFNIADYIKSKKNRATVTVLESTVASLSAAAVGISLVMPLDVVFVRFQVENALPLEQRRGYTGLGNAMLRIVREEGVGTLWRGILPAITRAMALNFGMLVPYDKCKSMLAPYLGWTRANFLASAAIAGFGAAFCCLPFDNVKIRLQKMKPGPDGKMPYRGVIDCFSKCIKKEGLGRLWSGFVPFYLFVAPHSMIVLLLSDALRIILGISKN